MKKDYLAFAGLAFGGIGISLGLAMSSAVPGTPGVLGTATGVYAALAAAILAGVRKKRADPSRE
jgi:hypothetical protein